MPPARSFQDLLDALADSVALDDAMPHVAAFIQAHVGRGTVSVNQNVTTLDDPPDEIQLQRVWTSHPREYPVAGRKRKHRTHWTETLFLHGRVFVGEGQDAIVRHFDDHALMTGLGLNAFANVPLTRDGHCLGALNVFIESPQWSDDALATVRLLGQLIAPWLAPHRALANRFVHDAQRPPCLPVPRPYRPERLAV